LKQKPLKNQGFEVPPVFHEAAIEGIRTHVHIAWAEVVFNLVEIGIGEWEDRAERKVILPSPTRQQSIFMEFTGD
jgi:hypothetical protein